MKQGAKEINESEDLKMGLEEFDKIYKKDLIEEIKKMKKCYLIKTIIALMIYIVSITFIILSFIFEEIQNVRSVGFILVGICPFIHAYRVGKEINKEYVQNSYVLSITGYKEIIRNDAPLWARIIYSIFAFIYMFALIINPILIILWILKFFRCCKTLKELYEKNIFFYNRFIFDFDYDKYQKNKDLLDFLMEEADYDYVLNLKDVFDDIEVEFKILSVMKIENNIYCLLKPLTKHEGLSDFEYLPYRVGGERGERTFYLEFDEKIRCAMFEEYEKSKKEVMQGRAKNKGQVVINGGSWKIYYK